MTLTDGAICSSLEASPAAGFLSTKVNVRRQYLKSVVPALGRVNSSTSAHVARTPSVSVVPPLNMVDVVTAAAVSPPLVRSSSPATSTTSCPSEWSHAPVVAVPVESGVTVR